MSVPLARCSRKASSGPKWGNDWNTGRATAVVCNHQVVQPVYQMLPGNLDAINRNRIIIDLNEQCGEGNVAILDGDWRVRHTPRIEKHRQYFRGWTFCLEPVRRNLIWVPLLKGLSLAMATVMIAVCLQR